MPLNLLKNLRARKPQKKIRTYVIKESVLLRRLPYYTFLYIPNSTGTSRKVQVPKIFVALALFAFLGSLGASLAMSLRMQDISSLHEENAALRTENHSIRAEAAALAAKLREVQENLTRVDKFSSEVRRETSQIDPVEAKSPKIRSGINLLDSAKKRLEDKNSKTEVLQNDAQHRLENEKKSLPKNIGPLTKEEFEFSKNPANVRLETGGIYLNTNSLEFKNLFKQVDYLRSKSSDQAESLAFLLKELQRYRQKLASTPTISPVAGMVTSLYGVRVSPITGQNRMHQGLDIAAPLGSSIKAAAQGIVTKIDYADDYGNYVEISHGFGVLSRYAHAKSIDIPLGTKVNKGDHIGKVGMTGRTTGPHLHYELEIAGKKIDPSQFIANLASEP